MRTILYNMGHRGAFLFLQGLAFIFYGVWLRYLPFHDNDLILTLHQWTWVWIIAGVLVLSGSFGCKDKMAFGLAALMSAWWSGRWFFLWAFHGASHGWSISILWAVITCSILVVSSWPEHGPRPKIERDRE